VEGIADAAARGRRSSGRWRRRRRTRKRTRMRPPVPRHLRRVGWRRRRRRRWRGRRTRRAAKAKTRTTRRMRTKQRRRRRLRQQHRKHPPQHHLLLHHYRIFDLLLLTSAFVHGGTPRGSSKAACTWAWRYVRIEQAFLPPSLPPSLPASPLSSSRSFIFSYTNRPANPAAWWAVSGSVC